MLRQAVRSALIVCATCTTLVAAQQQPPAAAGGRPAPAPQGPAPQGPASQTPAPQAPATPGQPGAPAAQTPVQTRTFTAAAGLLFNTVRPERAADFEKVMAYLQAALEKSTDERVRAQAAGWRIFKATEIVNGSTLYVYLLDPAVAGAEYGIGKILTDAYPEQADQIWKLYRESVSGGGSLLNLTPVKPIPPPPLEPAKSKP
jgi:hypothetical protein